jgi:hypothetical protein
MSRSGKMVASFFRICLALTVWRSTSGPVRYDLTWLAMLGGRLMLLNVNMKGFLFGLTCLPVSLGFGFDCLLCEAVLRF